MTETIEAPSLPPTEKASTTWIRRVAILLALVAAGGVLFYGTQRTQPGIEPDDRDPAVVLQIPAPGARALRQTQIGAELGAAYDGRLTINGIAIPEEEMEGAIDPDSVSPADLKQFGIRPNNQNRVFFTPGPGKVIESLPEGEVTVTVTYFRTRQNVQSGRSISWTFQAT